MKIFMRDIMHLLVIAGFIPVVAACSPDGVSDQSSAPIEANVEVTPLEVAENLYQKSQDLGFAWRATAELIEASKVSQQAGEVDAAQSQIRRAIALAEASIAQAQQEAVDWQARPPFGP